jgi:hypothetical protein
MKEILVFDIVGKNAISMNSGTKLHTVLLAEIEKEHLVNLNFEGVELFASPFFNASIGYALQDMSITDLQQKMKISGLSDVGNELLTLVIENAIKFYSESESLTSKAIDKVKKDMEG